LRFDTRVGNLYDTLVIMKRQWVVLIIAIGCAAAVAIGLLSRKPGAINVILISVDTLRPDHLGCYGYGDVSTPHIDNLAEEGVLFEDALTSVPLTLPSHASILTGLYPISHGIRDNGTFILRDQFTTLAEILKGHGFATGAFIGSFVLDARYGLDQGFDAYDDDMETDVQVSAFSHPERPAAPVTASTLDWLEEATEPFFAFVHYYDPHTPYEPPAPYDTIYAGRPYDGEIGYADSEIGRLMDFLEDRNLTERTVVVLVSDHGEGLGEHDETAHGILMYDTTMRVAFIVRIPERHDLAGAVDAPRRVPDTVELVDVLPTVVEVLGIEINQRLDGRSVLPLIEGRRLEPKVCYLETMYPYFSYRWSPLRGVRFNKWKYILAPEPELYNMAADPNELENLAGSYPARADELKANLLSLASLEQDSPPPTEVKLSAEEARKLQALGYVSTSRPSVPVDIEPKGTDPKHMIADLERLLGGGMEAFDRGEFEAAARFFREMTTRDPMNAKAHVYLGRSLMEMGDLEGAEVEFVKVIEIDSTHSQAFFRLGGIARMRGDLDQALFFYRIAAAILPETPETLSNIGSILMEKGQVDSALAMLDRALAIDPRDEIALINTGLVHLSLERSDEALRWFHRTLGANPNHVKALANIASIYVGRGETDSTILYLERASNADPADAKILQNLGNAYRQKGLVREATQAFEQATDLDPQNVLALFGLAATRAEEGRRDESIAILRRIIEIDPQFAPARQALTRLSSGS
jgi:arylsulfatase A-like enzyme/Tfp pilus assembly protein PilF